LDELQQLGRFVLYKALVCTAYPDLINIYLELSIDRLQQSGSFALYKALACTTDPDLINRYLELSIDQTSSIR
jgi:hypothetical protein